METWTCFLSLRSDGTVRNWPSSRCSTYSVHVECHNTPQQLPWYSAQHVGSGSIWVLALLLPRVLLWKEQNGSVMLVTKDLCIFILFAIIMILNITTDLLFYFQYSCGTCQQNLGCRDAEVYGSCWQCMSVRSITIDKKTKTVLGPNLTEQ